jgi:hypothetical protein
VLLFFCKWHWFSQPAGKGRRDEAVPDPTISWRFPRGGTWTHAPPIVVARGTHALPLFLPSQEYSSAIPEYLRVYFAISKLYHVKMMCEWSIVKVDVCVLLFFFLLANFENICAWFVVFNCVSLWYLFFKKKKCFPCMLHKANILTYFEFVFYFKKNKYSKFKIKCVLAWIS